MCKGIQSPGDRMLLFLVYHANLHLKAICQLDKSSADLFEGNYRLPGDNEAALMFYKSLHREVIEAYQPVQYLLEQNGEQHTIKTLKIKLYRILGHYRLEDIYRKQYRLILSGTDYSEKTRQMYLGAFTRFLKYFNYIECPEACGPGGGYPEAGTSAHAEAKFCYPLLTRRILKQSRLLCFMFMYCLVLRTRNCIPVIQEI